MQPPFRALPHRLLVATFQERVSGAFDGLKDNALTATCRWPKVVRIVEFSEDRSGLGGCEDEHRESRGRQPFPAADKSQVRVSGKWASSGP